MKKVIIAGIIGGIIVFVWGNISHQILPFHHQAHTRFTNEDEVLATMKKGATEPGMYLIPFADIEALPEAERETAKEKSWQDREGGFLVFSVVRPSGAGPFWVTMVYHSIGCLVGGILLAWILVQCANSAFIARMQFIKAVALFVIVAAILPNWTWWGFSDFYSILYGADVLIGWGLAGAVMCKILGPRPEAAAA